MLRAENPAVLEIRTVAAGFYSGFNLVVSMTAKVLILALVLLFVFSPDWAGETLGALKENALGIFGSWFIYLLAATLLFCCVLIVLPMSSRIKLGAPGDIPDHSTASWLTMMFCSGIGVGILVFAISEPISHQLTNPEIIAGDVLPRSAESAASSLRFVFLHWGFSAWACYALIGMALGLACFRDGQPLTMRSAVAPLFGKRLEGSVGHLIDIISILAIVSGITTTIVLGLEQICSGLSAITGSPFFADHAGDPPLTALLTALIVATSGAIGSVLSGVDKGVKWIANFGMMLAFLLLAVFAFSSSASWVVGTFIDSSLDYLRTLPSQALTVYGGPSEPEQAQMSWQGDWTVFYWAWWIAFAPFVGLFLAKISRGRSLREFIVGAVICPTIMCFIWFSVIGGSAILLELDGTAGGQIYDAPHAFRIYQTIDLLLTDVPAAAVKAIVALMFLVLIVASANAAIIAIKSIGAAGCAFADTSMHSAIWSVVIAAIAGAVMAVGGVNSIRDVMIVGAVPFSFVMALMLLSVLRTLFLARLEDRPRI